MWIRQDVDWQRDPFVITLDGCARHVLNTIWCLTGRHGTPTFGEGGVPEHGEIPLRYLESGYLANEAGFDAATVRRCVEQLRSPLPATDYTPEVPPPLVLDVVAGVAIVRNVAKFQERLLRDRFRKREERKVRTSTDSAGRPRTSADKPETSAEKRRVTNVTNERTESTASPADAVEPPRGKTKEQHPDALPAAQHLAEAIQSHQPTAKVNPPLWAKDLDLAIRIDSRTLDGLNAMSDYAHRDPSAWSGWRGVIRSGAKLRKHYDQLEAQRANPNRRPNDPEAARASLTRDRGYTP